VPLRRTLHFLPDMNVKSVMERMWKCLINMTGYTGHTYVRTYVPTYLCTIHAYIHTYIPTYTHAHTHAHLYIYIYIYAYCPGPGSKTLEGMWSRDVGGASRERRKRMKALTEFAFAPFICP
jgi:hypothetical protein